MTNLTVYVDDETGEPSRASIERESVKLEFNVSHADGDCVAQVDGCISTDLDDGYDPIKAFVDCQLVEQCIKIAERASVFDRVEAFGMVKE